MLIWHWGDTTRKIIIVLLCAILIVNFFGFIIPNNASAYTTHDSIYINGNTNFTAENGVTDGDGTQNDPYIIEGYDIKTQYNNGIEIHNTDAYFIIRNCYMHAKWGWNYGVYLHNVQNGRIENIISLNNGYGIYIYRSSCNDIYNNNILYHYRGIYLLDSSNNNIFNNNILTNYNGIYVFDSSNNNIFNNAVNSNSYAGIFILFASVNNNVYNNKISNNDEGIYLYAGSNNIYNNIITSNYYSGVWCQSDGSIIRNNEINDNFIGIPCVFRDCVIEGNTLSNNFCGIYIIWGKNNKIIHNNFIDNVIQGYDFDINQWDDGYPSGGNYWSEYTGVDEKSGPNQDQPGSDGIGDTPYNISGGANIDQYPLMYPWRKPRISVEKKFIPSEITTISQGAITTINITNTGDVNITSMTVIDEHVENMRPNDPSEVFVTITSDEGDIYAIMPEDLTVTPTDNNITISFELPLEVVPVYWENGMLQFGEGSYYLESIPKDWIVGVQYLLHPITELEIGIYTADATVTAYSETGESATETATGTLTVSGPIELEWNLP